MLTSVTVETVRTLEALGILLLATFVALKALFIFPVQVKEAAESVKFSSPVLCFARTQRKPCVT